MLKKEEIDVNKSNKNGHTPLVCSCLAEAEGEEDKEAERIQITRLILEKGGDVNIAANRGCTALYVAAASVELVTLLLNHNADPSLTCKDKYRDDKVLTPLQVAGLEGHDEVIKILKEHEESAKKQATSTTTSEKQKRKANTAVTPSPNTRPKRSRK